MKTKTILMCCVIFLSYCATEPYDVKQVVGKAKTEYTYNVNYFEKAPDCPVCNEDGNYLDSRKVNSDNIVIIHRFNCIDGHKWIIKDIKDGSKETVVIK